MKQNAKHEMTIKKKESKPTEPNLKEVKKLNNIRVSDPPEDVNLFIFIHSRSHLTSHSSIQV
mgnify:CR=1 FL=1